MARGGRIWVTRAQPGADGTAACLRGLGHDPLVASLLSVHLLPQEGWPPPEPVAALAFTSANAVRAFARWTLQRDTPVFAVGEATAKAARLAGFADVSSADGDVAALAARIAAETRPGLLLHPCASETAGDLSGALAARNVNLRTLPLYETRPVDRLPPEVVDAFHEAEVATVLLHSPKAAGALANLSASLAETDLARVRLLGLSAACLAPMAHLSFASSQAAAEPNETAMLELL